MSAPRRIEVGPLVYKVVRADIDDYGQCDHDLFEIRLRRRLTREASRETLMHETMHACFDVAGIEVDEEVEERVIRRLSPILLDTLRRNESLSDYLLG